MTKKQQRFTQKPTVFEPTQEEIDAVLADVFEAERLARENHALEMLAADAESGEVRDIEQQPDFETCWNCGGAFGFGTSYEPDALEVCPVCGNVLSVRPDINHESRREDNNDDDDDYDIYDDEICQECGQSAGPLCDCRYALSEDTKPIPPLSERAEIVDEAIREDERALEADYGLAWVVDMPIPFVITPLGEEWLSDHA